MPLRQDGVEVRVVAPQRVDRLRLGDVAPERGAGGHAVAEKVPVEEGRDVGAEEVDAAASLGEAARVLEHLLKPRAWRDAVHGSGRVRRLSRKHVRVAVQRLLEDDGAALL